MFQMIGVLVAFLIHIKFADASFSYHTYRAMVVRKMNQILEKIAHLSNDKFNWVMNEINSSKNALHRGSEISLAARLGASATHRSGSLTQVRVQQAAQNGQRLFENTYRIQPERKFPTELARCKAQEILDRNLIQSKYSPEQAAILTKVISQEILNALKQLQIERYKIVVDVNIGEFRGQGIRCCSRALWDPSSDTLTSVCFRNATLFCVALVFGVYFE